MGNEHDTPSTPEGLDENALRAASRQGLLTGDQLDLLLEDLERGISIDTFFLGERLGFDEGTSEDLVRFAGEHSSPMVAQDEGETFFEPEAPLPEQGPTHLSDGFFEEVRQARFGSVPSGKRSPLWPDDLPPRFDLETDLFGRYERIEVIDRGGMGAILSAYDPNSDREVVVKTLLPEHAHKRKAVRRFLREAHITARLEHPNIVPIHEVGFSSEHGLYFSMQRVKGESLAQRIRRQRVLEGAREYTALQALRDLLKVCDALALAHSRGVVHRDLKPDNIMIGEFGEILVMDWGIARTDDTVSDSSGSRPLDPHRTADGAVLGTLSYMPPEQAEGRMQEIDHRSDIYALGAILYEVLTLRCAQSGSQLAQVFALIVQGAAEKALRSPQACDVPRELAAVIRKAMAVEPVDRYASVVAFRSDLEAYLDGRTLAGVRYNPLQRFGKWIVRHRVPATVAAVVLLLAGGLFGGYLRLQHQQEEDRFAQALEEATGRLQGLGDIEDLTAERPPIDTRSGQEWREPPAEAERRKRAVEAHVIACSALDRALQIRPEDEKVVRLRREAGLALGRMAVRGREYALARQAFLQLDRSGLDRSEVATYMHQVDEAEAALLTWRRDRLHIILKDLRDGLSRKGRPAGAERLPDYVLEGIGYRDLQTVKILSRDLGELVAAAREEGQKVRWSQSDRDRATFICRVLGRLGFPECVVPLGEWMAVLTDHELAVEVGLALCNTRHAGAQPHLIAARDRLGVNSQSWGQIAEYLVRVPESDSSPASSTAKEFLERGMLYSSKKRYEEAIAEYSRAIEIDPEFVSAYNNRGNAFFEKGDLDAAIADCTRAIQINPKYHSAYLNRGIVLKTKGDLDGAIADYGKAIEIDPRYAFAYANRGVARNIKGDFQGAITDFNRAIELDATRADTYQNRGIVFQEIGDLDAAIADFTKAIQIDPAFAVAYNNRGRVFFEKGDFEVAISDFDTAIALDPTFALAYNNRANALGHQGNLDAAHADLDTAIQIAPEMAVIHYTRGFVFLKGGDLNAAIAHFSTALRIDPKLGYAYNDRGYALQQRGDLDAALTDYNQAISLNSKYAIAHLNRANLFNQKGDLIRAIADYTRAIQIDPAYAQACCNRGIALGKRGDLQAAIADFTRAIQIDPELGDAYFARGAALAKRGNVDAAIADFTRLIHIDPEHASAYNNRGNQLKKKGKVDAAIVDFREALRLQPHFWQALANLGVCLDRKGQPAEALEALRKAHSLAPAGAHPKIARLIQQVEGKR